MCIRDSIRADHCRHDAELDFGQRKMNIVSCHGDITGGNQTHTTAIGRALHTRNGWLAQLVQRRHHLGELMRVAQVFLRRIVGNTLHPVEVGTGAKTLPGRGQHDGTHPWIRLKLTQADR